MVFLHVRQAARIFRPNGSLLGRYHHSAVEGTCTTNLTKLTERKVLRVKGRDSSKFLQGIITNDMNCLTQGHSKMLYTMFLNAQGRALYDAFLYPVPGESNEYFLECDASSSDDVIQHMRKYKLRAKVEVSDASEEMQVWALFSCNGKLGDEITNRSHNFVVQQDARLYELGMRMIVPLTQSPEELLGIKECITADSAAYKEHRYHLGIAEGIQEVPLGNALPLEYNLAITNGVSFSKGCYIGQELTARTHHTGLIRKRIMPIQLKAEGEMMSYPKFMPQTPIKTSTGKSAGRLCAMLGQYGLGLLRLKEVFDSEYLLLPCKEGNDYKLAASKPNWWPEDLKY